MKNLSRILLTALFLGMAGSPAMAQGFFYGGVDIGQTKASDVCTGAGAGCTDTAATFRIAGNYQFVPALAAEISYGNYGKQGLGTVGGASLGDWKASGYQIAGIGSFPLGEGFFLTGKAGLAATKLEMTGTNRSATTTNLAFGVGGRYDVTRDVGVRVQYESLGNVGDSTTGKTKLSLITAGILFRF